MSNDSKWGKLRKRLGVERIVEKPKTGNSTMDRILERFEEAQIFHDEHGRPPSPAADEYDEQVLARNVQAIINNPAYADILAIHDRNCLVGKFRETDDAGESPRMTYSEIREKLGIKPAETNIQSLSHVRHSSIRNAPDQIANREPCPDFEKYKRMFRVVHGDIDDGVRRTKFYVDLKEKKVEQVKEGVFFIVGGQTALIAEVGEIHRQRGVPDARITVVFDNGTQCKLLRSSFLKALWRDSNSRLIEEPPIMGDRLDEVDIVTGHIYVARSESDDPVVARHRDVLHKIGFTTQPVRKRLSNTENDPTFLLAKVKLIDTYELVGVNGRTVERALHEFFAPAMVDWRLTDLYGKPYKPKEWFILSPDIIARAIELVRLRSLHMHRFDMEKNEIFPIDSD